MSKGEELAKELAEDFSLERLKGFLFEKDFAKEEEEIFIDLKRDDLREKVHSIWRVAGKKLEDLGNFGNFKVYAIELKKTSQKGAVKKDSLRSPRKS